MDERAMMLNNGISIMERDVKIYNLRVRNLQKYLELRGDISTIDPKENRMRDRIDITLKKLSGMREMYNLLMGVYSRFVFDGLEYCSPIVSIEVSTTDNHDFTWRF